MKDISAFRRFISRIKLTPHRLAELNNLIFYNWDASEAAKYFPPEIIQLISEVQMDEEALDEVYDCLLPRDFPG